MTSIEAIAELIGRRREAVPAIDRLSDDPVTLARILLLFRVVLADGVVEAGELAMFERICRAHFGIDPADMPALHALLESPAGHAAEADMTTLITTLDSAERRVLLGLMTRLAESGTEAPDVAERLVRRTARLLDPESRPSEE